MELTNKTASGQAKSAVVEMLEAAGKDSHAGFVTAESSYTNAGGRRLPQYAASHVKTEVWTSSTGRDLLEPMRRALAALPGAVASGVFLGDYERNLRPRAWVIRETEWDTPWEPPTPLQTAVTTNGPVEDRGHTHTCTVCGRRFTGVRSDAQYCSNACRQRAYRDRQD
jgi:hypothetical protein